MYKSMCASGCSLHVPRGYENWIESPSLHYGVWWWSNRSVVWNVLEVLRADVKNGIPLAT